MRLLTTDGVIKILQYHFCIFCVSKEDTGTVGIMIVFDRDGWGICEVGISGAKQNMKKPYLYQKMDPKSKYIRDPEHKLSDVNYEIPLGHGEISRGGGVHSLRQSLHTDWSDPLLIYRFCKQKSLIYFCVQLFTSTLIL